MIGDIMLCTDHSCAFCGFFKSHVVNAVTAEERIVDFFLRQAGHLLCCGSIAGYINGFSVAKCQYIACAFIYIVHTVKTRFYRLDRYIAEFKSLMYTFDYSFFPCDGPTIRVSIRYLIGCVVVKVRMSYKNQNLST